MVNTREEAEAAVSACKYPPVGVRGVGPRRAFLRDPEYIETANDEILIVVMIETQKALDNLDEIFSVPGIDACFIGPWDLSMNLGVGPPPPWDDQGFKDVLGGVVEACERNGIAPGMHCNIDNINMAIDMGFRFCAIDADASFMVQGAKDAIGVVKGWAPTK
jgi:4-hydroxy-2-oxoheptanedioate aldolase